jgi:hypothetical protein
MRPRKGAWLEFGAFLLITVVLIGAHRRFHSLDHWMALIWLGFLVVAGVYALIKTYSGKSRYSMPSFLGALPPSWQRWFLGESDNRKR